MTVTFFGRYFTSYYTDGFHGTDSSTTVKALRDIARAALGKAPCNSVSVISGRIICILAEIKEGQSKRDLAQCYDKLLLCRGELELFRRAKITFETAIDHFIAIEARKERIETARMYSRLVLNYDHLAKTFEEAVDLFIEKYNRLYDEPIGDYPIVNFGRGFARYLTHKSCVGYLGTQFDAIPFKNKYEYLKSIEAPLPYDTLPSEGEKRMLFKNALALLGLLYKMPEGDALYCVYQSRLNNLTLSIRCKGQPFVLFPEHEDSKKDLIDPHVV